MNPLEFYCLILKNMDKNLAKKLGKIEKKYTNVPFENDEIAKVKIKSKFASEMGFFVLNSATSLAVDEENYNFAYCLKILELYPIKNNDFFYWNEHIKLFSELEKNNFLDEDVCKLHDFLVNNFSFNGDLKNIISHEMLRNSGVNILLILIHLDHLISKKWGFQSISLNQALKFKFKNKRPYFPSKTFTDFLLFILKINAKFEATKGHKVEILKTIPPTNGFEQWLDPSLEDEQIKEFIQLIKKVRENRRLCYLNEVYKFLGLPYGEFKNDEIYEQVSEENYLFLKNELPEDKWFESINAIAGLWLIYFWQDFYYKHFQKTASVSTLATSEDFIVIWEAFLKKYPSEGQYLWPSELILQDK